MSQMIVFAVLATFATTVATILLLLPLAGRLGLVDAPGELKRHAVATPAVGGLAILLAIMLACALVVRLTPQLLGLGAAALVIVISGVVDDIVRLRWPYRLGSQILATLIMIFWGGVQVENIGTVFGVPVHSLGPIAIPLTLLATVGIINAINMIDGVDGLAGSVSFVAVVMLAVVASYAGNKILADELLLVIGGIVGFLVFNLRTPWRRRASTFLGNAGSELLGFVIACASVRLTQNGQHPVGVQLAPFLVAPILIDCLTLILRRIRGGASPFLGDRNHLHHLLLDAGFTTSLVVATIAGATLLIGGVALLAMKAHTPAVMFSLAFVLMWASFFLATGRRDRSVERLSQLAGWLGLAVTLRPRPLWQGLWIEPRGLSPAAADTQAVKDR
jgi:UDP-GlcNAc:undecaprenyl-phosphate GlcNAc-1-phosphate transferase